MIAPTLKEQAPSLRAASITAMILCFQWPDIFR